MPEPNEVLEKEVVEQVQNEIKTLGNNVKGISESLQNNYKSLQQTIDKQGKRLDALDALKIDRLANDIATRQEGLDKISDSQKQIQERIDQFEVVLGRLPSIEAGHSQDIPQMDEVRSFLLAATTAKGGNTSFTEVDKLNMEIEEYNNYKKTLDYYLRRGLEQTQLLPDGAKFLSVGVDPSGGYTVTPYMSNRIMERMYEMDPIRALASVQSISTDAFEMLADWGDAGVEWVGKETSVTTNDTTPTLNMIRIPVHEMQTRPRITQKLLEDSSINVESWLARKVADRFARGEATAFVEGDGVNQPKGFLSYTSGTGFDQVQQVAMGAAAALTADGFISIKYALKEFFLTRGTWLMQRSTLAAAMKLKDGTGGYIWKPGLIAADTDSTICGLPVRMSPTMPTVAANALAVALADWAEAYLIVDRLGITVQRDPYTVKPMVEFYTRKRVGGGVLNFEAIKLGIIST